MERPILIRHRTPQAARQRALSLALVAALHLIVVYAFISGLAFRVVEKVPEELKAVIVPPKIVQPKPVPPPPKLAEPPPPYVPPPDIVIESATPPTSTITTQSSAPGPSAQSNAPADVATAPVGNTHNCDAFYPPISQRLAQQGKVLVRYTVGTDGRIVDVVIIQSSGFVPLDQAALQCVRQRWRNTPALQNGKPVQSTSEAYISFEMH